jgi:hypothetical protein
VISLNPRRVLFRLWIVSGALFVLGVGTASHNSIREEFRVSRIDYDVIAKKYGGETLLPVECGQARGVATTDYAKPAFVAPHVLLGSDLPCGLRSPKQTGTDLSLHLAVTPELVPYWHCDRAICLETLRPSSIPIWQIQGQPDRPLVWSKRFPPNSSRQIMD